MRSPFPRPPVGRRRLPRQGAGRFLPHVGRDFASAHSSIQHLVLQYHSTSHGAPDARHVAPRRRPSRRRVARSRPTPGSRSFPLGFEPDFSSNRKGMVRVRTVPSPGWTWVRSFRSSRSRKVPSQCVQPPIDRRKALSDGEDDWKDLPTKPRRTRFRPNRRPDAERGPGKRRRRDCRHGNALNVPASRRNAAVERAREPLKVRGKGQDRKQCRKAPEEEER